MQTLMVKIETTPEQAHAPHETMHQFNAACNDIAKTAFELHCANKIELQKTVYYRIREQYNLSAQMAVRAISKTVEAYKRDKSIQPEFDLDGAMPYDQRIMSWKGLDRVSLLTLEGRLIMPVRICDYYTDRMNRPRGQVDLIYRNKAFYLAVVDAPEASIDATAVPGIDLSVKNISVDSTGESFSGDGIEKVRTKLDIIKAAISGVPVVYINPAHTSQECPICHCISKSNRPSRDDFC
jgi:putative transposase